ncbi:MAG: cytochrome P450 [Campylobacterota bacterium]|nr:cytochrome P450 [Campylobacterota bacterium]
MKVYPHYPKPVTNKFSQFMMFFKKKSSWLDWICERSYTMYLGELKLPGLSMYIPNEASLIHRIMVTELDHFPKNRLLHELLNPLLGDSIFTTNGAVWKKQREMLNPSFEMVRVSHVFSLMNASAKDMRGRLSQLEEGRIHDMNEEMTFVTADIIFRTILSKELTLEASHKLVNAFEIFQEKNTKVGMQTMFRIPKVFRVFNGEKERLNAGIMIRETLADIIRPRYESMMKGESNTYTDILSSLLQVIDKDTGKPFPFNEILDQVAMLFLAGHETSASSMTWTLYLLALYPQYQEEAYEEVISKCGMDEFTAENTKALQFITNVFKESLRLYPPVSFIPREVNVDIQMRSKQIKKGSTIVMSPWLMHRNERYWEDAHMFNPHRFDDPKNITKYTYFPFGMGQRNCIGANFAMQEGVLLLATIIRDYTLELKDGFVPDVVSRLTTRSMNGMPVKLIKRR